MANRAGLRKVTKTVRGKKGSVKRSYWVKSQGAAKASGGKMGVAQFVKKHGAKMYGGIAATHMLSGAIANSVSRKKGIDAGLNAGAISSLAGSVAHAATKSGRAATADYHRLNFGGRLAANALGLGAAAAGGIAGMAGSHFAHNAYDRRPRKPGKALALRNHMTRV